MADDLVDDFILNDVPSDTEEPKRKKRKKKRISEEPKIVIEDNEDPKEDFLDKLDDFFKHNLSSIEREAMNFGEGSFLTSNINHKTLSDYLKEIMTDWDKLINDKTKSKKGSPFIIVLASSALRAVDLNREANDFKTKKCKTAKLFAKHMKLKDQSQFLEKNDIHFAVGTPNRVSSLLELGSLQTGQLKAIVIDWYWKDLKQRKIVNIPETRKDLFVLFQKHFSSCLGTDQLDTKIALF
ncbi:DgyrCDS5940 [Dimorphilus gyrociliatus]|uniref:DgyrCDS5940 n=1 Tax=Dimorphilus gyrociliatus TaxID=2664684 RepID=A0A7I8VLF8_9ANNE|nr:DgyrCDS5940 [Dimorphilus gyrociliatus]